jgi:hypothetical protein
MSTDDCRLPILDSGLSILDSRFSIPDSRFSILDRGFSIRDSRSAILDRGFSILNSQLSIENKNKLSRLQYWCGRDCSPRLMNDEGLEAEGEDEGLEWIAGVLIS